MKLFASTRYWENYWQKRKVDWKKDYFDIWTHPHHYLISRFLKGIDWFSLIEVGVGGGANLANIANTIGGKQLGGVDISPEAIEFCRKNFKNGLFRISGADDLILSDKSCDVVLSDMCLIYVSPFKIKKCLREMKRVARKYVLLCEFHHLSFFKRLLLKWNSGYNAYNYKKILGKLEFYDIIEHKLREEDWPFGEPQKTYGYIILAKVPSL